MVVFNQLFRNAFKGFRICDITKSTNLRPILSVMARYNSATSKSYSKQRFDYFLVLDFEATCDENVKIHPQEIIEFPVLKFNPNTLAIDSTFHQYVQPKVHPVLTPFCTELTGIIQDMVDGQPFLQETLLKFHKWMKDENLLNPEVSFAFVTCGDWDLKTVLPKQCSYFHLPVPEYFSRWINIKSAFADMTGVFPKGMMPMLNQLKLTHQGRHHCGIDDCKNIANILHAMLEKGYIFDYTGHREPERSSQQH